MLDQPAENDDLQRCKRHPMLLNRWESLALLEVCLDPMMEGKQIGPPGLAGGGDQSLEKGGNRVSHGFRITVRLTVAGLEITIEPL